MSEIEAESLTDAYEVAAKLAGLPWPEIDELFVATALEWREEVVADNTLTYLARQLEGRNPAELSRLSQTLQLITGNPRMGHCGSPTISISSSATPKCSAISPDD